MSAPFALVRIGLAMLFASVLACGSPAPVRSAAGATSGEVATSTGEARSAPDAGKAPPAPRCRLTVAEASGCTPDDVEALIEPARPRLEPCLGPSGGKVRLRVRDVEGRLSVEIEPGSSLDATQKQCVLEALTTIHDDGVRPPWTGATVRPTGFTSLITIEW